MTRNHWQLLVFLLLLFTACAVPRHVRGQEVSPSPFEALATDSAAWQRVITAVVEMLSSRIVSSATDASAQPWEVKVPPDEPQRSLLEAQLRTILRARQPAADDSVTYTLELGPLRIDGDTARAELRTEVVQRCPNNTGTKGWSNTGDVLIPRTQYGFWGRGRMGVVVHADNFGCRNR